MTRHRFSAKNWFRVWLAGLFILGVASGISAQSNTRVSVLHQPCIPGSAASLSEIVIPSVMGHSIPTVESFQRIPRLAEGTYSTDI